MPSQEHEEKLSITGSFFYFNNSFNTSKFVCLMQSKMYFYQ